MGLNVSKTTGLQWIGVTLMRLQQQLASRSRRRSTCYERKKSQTPVPLLSANCYSKWGRTYAIKWIVTLQSLDWLSFSPEKKKKSRCSWCVDTWSHGQCSYLHTHGFDCACVCLCVYMCICVCECVSFSFSAMPLAVFWRSAHSSVRESAVGGWLFGMPLPCILTFQPFSRATE